MTNNIIYKNTVSKLVLQIPCFITIISSMLLVFTMSRSMIFLPILMIIVCLLMLFIFIPMIVNKSNILVTDKHISYNFGFLSNINETVMLDKISKVSVSQNLIELILNVGKLIIIDISGEKMIFGLIDQPQFVANLVINQISKK